MVGRYGTDQLFNFMTAVSMILLIVSLFFRASVAGTVLWIAALVLLILGYCRCFSRKTGKRFRENQKYLKVRSKVTGRFRALFDRIKQSKTHRFYKCPNCKQTVRVPKGKGKIRIRCPKCGESFIRKS